jgi:hypothetical protein
MIKTVSKWVKDFFTKKHKSVFLGREVKKEYTGYVKRVCGNFNQYEVYSSPEIDTIKRVPISEIEGKIIFNKNEEVYIPELNVYTTITDVARDIDGNYTYTVSHVISCDENLEQYEQQKAKCDLDSTNYNQAKLQEEKEYQEYKILMDKRRANPNTKIIHMQIPLNENSNKSDDYKIDMSTVAKFIKKINMQLPDNKMAIVSPFIVKDIN